MSADTIDERVRVYLEGRTGVPLSTFPAEGIAVAETPNRTNAPRNRLMAHRLAGYNGILVTVRPGSVDAVARVVEGMTPCEVFSPFGHAELSRAVGCDGSDRDDYIYGFGYVLASLRDFRPTDIPHAATPLREKDIPEEQRRLRMSERRLPPVEDSIWAFACHRDDDPAYRATELASIGSQCASIAMAKWTDGPVARLDVRTEASCRGQGYGTATVSATAKWILEQGQVAIYDAYANNVPSLRIARRLGFAWMNQEMRV